MDSSGPTWKDPEETKGGRRDLGLGLGLDLGGFGLGLVG